MHIYFDDGWAVEEAKITDKVLIMDCNIYQK